jgi:hypothetical protein
MKINGYMVTSNKQSPIITVTVKPTHTVTSIKQSPIITDTVTSNKQSPIITDTINFDHFYSNWLESANNQTTYWVTALTYIF